jgi:hypothetical protein
MSLEFQFEKELMAHFKGLVRIETAIEQYSKDDLR